MTEDALKQKFYSLSSGGAFQSLPRFLKECKTLKIPERDITAFYKRQTLTQLNRLHRRPHFYRQYYAGQLNHTLAMDAIYIPKSGRPRIKYAYIGENLTTKQCALYFTTALTGLKAGKALEVFADKLSIPTHESAVLETDRGSDFTGQTFARFVTEMDIQHRFSNPMSQNHVAPLERLNRTLRAIATKITRAPIEVMKRRLTMADALSAAVDIYNSTPSERTGYAPNQISQANYGKYQLKLEQNHARALDSYLSAHPHAHLPSHPRFKVGQIVRRQLAGISWEDEINHQRSTSTFRKEHSNLKYSVALYRISAILPSSPVPSYRLETSAGLQYPGTFTSDQLQSISSP